MNDKIFDRTVSVLGIILGVYWYLKSKGQNGNTTIITGSNVPNMNDYMAGNSGQPNIQMGNSPSINVNVGNQGLSYLSNDYIPLFGFVGEAVGTPKQQAINKMALTVINPLPPPEIPNFQPQQNPRQTIYMQGYESQRTIQLLDAQNNANYVYSMG